MPAAEKAEITWLAAAALAGDPAMCGRRVRVWRWWEMEALSEREGKMKREWYVPAVPATQEAKVGG